MKKVRKYYKDYKGNYNISNSTMSHLVLKKGEQLKKGIELNKNNLTTRSPATARLYRVVDKNKPVTEASLQIFKVNGKGGLPKDASNLEMIWHDHPDVLVNNITSRQLGEATPSDSDVNVQGILEERGYTGNVITVGIHSNSVSYYNSKGSIINVNFDDWKNAGIKATMNYLQPIINNINSK
ncbi:hypothetical protein CHRYSEOSP005_29400 [Chryseobacterium sp. Alg-005]|uniref:hypothetical protein n=1 Tax=Chryseobacterium sp. Alg-005 TaxID=3159516 RepID=UPI003555A89C